MLYCLSINICTENLLSIFIQSVQKETQLTGETDNYDNYARCDIYIFLKKKLLKFLMSLISF